MIRTLLAMLALLASGTAIAQSFTDPVTIIQIRTGWFQDAFAVVTQEPVINPAGCAVDDGYISYGAEPGYQTYYSAALTAFALGVPAVVTVSDTDCNSDRPVLIGINPTLP